jgi:hypothetical protein
MKKMHVSLVAQLVGNKVRTQTHTCLIIKPVLSCFLCHLRKLQGQTRPIQRSWMLKTCSPCRFLVQADLSPWVVLPGMANFPVPCVNQTEERQFLFINQTGGIQRALWVWKVWLSLQDCVVLALALSRLCKRLLPTPPPGPHLPAPMFSLLHCPACLCSSPPSDPF